MKYHHHFITYITIALLATIMLVNISSSFSSSSSAAQAQLAPQQPKSTSITPSAVNFTKLFAEKLPKPPVGIDSALITVSLVYQSSTTVVLQGTAVLDAIFYKPHYNHILYNNQYLWAAVDLVKQQGYSIDSVLTSGLNTLDNPTLYTVVLSKK